MKAALALLLLLAPLCDAAGFMGARHSALGHVGQALKHEDKEMPLTKHNKTAGDDYNPGSPLHKKQEQRKAAGIVSDTAKPVTKDEKEGALKGHDSQGVQDPGHWYNLWHGGSDHEFLKKGLYYFMTYFINTMLMALIWMKCLSPNGFFVYSKEGHDERPNIATKDFGGMGFAYGLFSKDHCMGHHFSICFCAVCCGPLRLADTYSKQPMPVVKGSFVVALLLVTCLIGLGPLTCGVSGLFLFCYAISARQSIRKKYGIASGGSTYVYDCLSWWACPCCAAIQEARQVDFVVPDRKTNY